MYCHSRPAGAEEQPLTAPSTQQTRRSASTLTNLMDSFSRSVLQRRQGSNSSNGTSSIPSAVLVATAK